MVARRQIILSVEPAMYAGLEQRAAAMGRKISDFAQMLFDAAYSVRLRRDIGYPVDDVELDASVRAVFCLAGELKPREIAKVTGFSPDMVDNILRGFAKVSAERRDTDRQAPPAGEGGGAAPKPTQTAAPAERKLADELRTPSQFTPEDLRELRNAYKLGISVREIAASLNCKVGALEMYISKHRDVFPHRGRS